MSQYCNTVTLFTDSSECSLWLLKCFSAQQQFRVRLNSPSCGRELKLARDLLQFFGVLGLHPSVFLNVQNISFLMLSDRSVK